MPGEGRGPIVTTLNQLPKHAETLGTEAGNRYTNFLLEIRSEKQQENSLT